MNRADQRTAVGAFAMICIVLMFVALCIAIIAAPVRAQTVASEDNALPPCWPKSVGGKGTFHRWAATGDGAYIGWWCPKADGTWQRVSIISVPGYVIKEPPGPFTSVAAELEAYWRLNVTGKPEPAHIGWHYTAMASDQALAAIRPADLPPPPVKDWVVAPAAIGSRPLYNVVNGVLAPTAQRTAATASPQIACDCATPFVSGTSTYCPPVGRAPLVALCKQP